MRTPFLIAGFVELALAGCADLEPGPDPRGWPEAPVWHALGEVEPGEVDLSFDGVQPWIWARVGGTATAFGPGAPAPLTLTGDVAQLLVATDPMGSRLVVLDSQGQVQAGLLGELKPVGEGVATLVSVLPRRAWEGLTHLGHPVGPPAAATWRGLPDARGRVRTAVAREGDRTVLRRSESTGVVNTVVVPDVGESTLLGLDAESRAWLRSEEHLVRVDPQGQTLQRVDTPVDASAFAVDTEGRLAVVAGREVRLFVPATLP